MWYLASCVKNQKRFKTRPITSTYLLKIDFSSSHNDDIPENLEKLSRNQKTELKKFKIFSVVAPAICLISYVIYILGAPETDHQSLPVEDDLWRKPLLMQYFIRTFRELRYYRRLLHAPSTESILPEPLPFPYVQPKYTLVLELTDVLIHPEWSYQSGWRYKKRPLLNHFLETLNGKYEIVIYTAQQGIIVFPLIEVLDPKKIIAHKLVRDATYFVGGQHVKVLNKLNRDLSKVVCVDWNAKNLKYNPENLFNIKRWAGTDHDTTLIDLASFLKTIVANDIDDVREVLKYYSQYEDPIEAYKEKQQKLIKELEEQAAADKETT